MGDVYTNPPQSRNEAILRATIDGTEYTAPPQSRIEDLLLELKEAIEQGGGAGGMSKDTYDPDDVVANAGGIATYVDDEITDLHLGTASTKNSTSVVTDSSDLVESGAVKEEIDRIDAQLEALSTHRIYGFHIKANESDPDNMVTYLADAVDAIPAYMDYARNVFDYGTWEHAFFMPKPCMLKSDGTVAYYLKEDDYTKKADGTASDIANTAFDGNAMMEWGQNGKKIWMKIQPDSNHLGASVFIADYQADPDFHDWPFHNSEGVSMDYFYTPIYNGSIISDKMRSLSGQQVSNKKTCAQEITAAQLNNPTGQLMWNTEMHCDIDLINMLLILMGKSVNVQAVFGEGLHTGGSEAINNAFRTGVHNTKGLFYGTNSGTVTSSDFSNAVKVFGMENWWGFQWRRYQGHVLVNGAQKVKNTYGTEDGSTATSYTVGGVPTGDGYKSTGAPALSGTSGNYIKTEYFTEDGMFPCGSLDGSATTYYCDACWYNNSGVVVPYRGGHSNVGSKVGAFYLDLSSTASYSAWHFGACLSCKPLAQG